MLIFKQSNLDFLPPHTSGPAPCASHNQYAPSDVRNAMGTNEVAENDFLLYIQAQLEGAPPAIPNTDTSAHQPQAAAQFATSATSLSANVAASLSGQSFFPFILPAHVNAPIHIPSIPSLSQGRSRDMQL